MATATVQDIRNFFPQFADTDQYPDAQITGALTRAAAEIKGVNTGDALYTEGHALLAAHKLALGAIASQSGGGNSGSFAGVSISQEVSVQFSQNPASKAGANTGYAATAYGVEFIEWRKRVIVPIGIF